MIDDIKNNYIEEKENDKTEESKQVMHEDSEGNYRYRGFWSGFGDQ